MSFRAAWVVGTAADANWFLSTVAEVNATLVAIIGGFLLSRLIAAGSERRSLQREIQEESSRRTRLESDFKTLDHELMGQDAHAWVDAVTDMIVDQWGAVSIETVLQAYPSMRSSADLQPYFDRAVRDVQSAMAEFDGCFVDDEGPPPDIEDLVDLVAMDDLKRHAFWSVYIRMTNEFAKKASRFLTIPFSEPDPEPELPEVVLVERRRIRREAEESLRDLRARERAARERLEQLDSALKSREPVQGAWIGFVLFGALAVVGVLVPLVLMARLTMGLSTGAAHLLVVLIGIAFVAVLGYLGLLVHANTGGLKKDQPPSQRRTIGHDRCDDES